MIRFRFSISKDLSRDVIGMLSVVYNRKMFHKFNKLKIDFFFDYKTRSERQPEPLTFITLSLP